MQLQDIPRVHTITKKEFLRDYVKPQKPVVIEHLIDDWKAYNTWKLSYIKEIAGDKEVPLYDDRPVKHDEGFNQAHATMKMSEYIDLLKKGPTNFRIFLYNLMKEVPSLKNDFKFPKIGLRLLKQIPMLFFGGTGSKVFMHHDIDWANILHFHFEGRKQCILFPPSETPHLYKVPYSLITREDIDFDNPDYDKFPALKKAKGHICHLNHGETLYMPEGYWHFMKYETPGFSMSLRALPSSFKHLRYALYNVFYMRHYDNFMRRRKGQSWIDEKNERAMRQTNRNNGIV
ncbi:cupin-like domain-containing protein [Dokdonia sinensis]|uniref:Cupin-like domain-containing protein n=1 Tax=Dokdonia sinensis TaxID=2479847 RepID=A0A3M0FUU0_9FLAO|nr:cupin-like domain-containing protein [Dokdonia sinensis]RMB56421.1 cupin-like domain-containing protein [Dokdonia sinensis]